MLAEVIREHGLRPEGDPNPAAFRLQHYHQVSDQVHPEWKLAGVERDVRLLLEA